MSKLPANWKARVGLTVCDCWFDHQTITAINSDDPDIVTLDNGLVCSFSQCCEPADHPGHQLRDMPQGWKPQCHYLLNKDRKR